MPVISAYLVWQRREELIRLPIKPAISGLAVIVLCSVFWLSVSLLRNTIPSALRVSFFWPGSCCFMWLVLVEETVASCCLFVFHDSAPYILYDAISLSA